MPVRVLTRVGSLTGQSQLDGTASADLQQIVTGVTSELEVATAADTFTGATVYRRGDPHPSYGTSRIVTSVRITQKDSTDSWDVDVTFGGQTYEDRSTAVDTEWQWEIGSQTLSVFEDFNGRPFLDRNGQPFSDPASVETKTLFLHVYRTMIYDVPTAWVSMTKVNTEPLNLFSRLFVDKGQMICWTIAPEGTQTRDNQPTRVKFTFEFRDGYRPFQDLRMQRSFQAFVSDSGNVLGQICDQRGNPVSEAVLINTNGQPIEPSYRVLSPKASGLVGASIANPSPPVSTGPNAVQEVVIFDGFCRTIQPNYGGFDFRGFIPGVM